MRLAVAAAVATLLLGACPAPTTTGDSRTVGVVTVTFRADPARIRLGESFQLTLRMVNNSGQAQELSFPTSQRYDFWATRGGSEVWRWSDDQVFAPVVEREEIPGQTGVTWQESWTPEAAGTYEVQGEIQAERYRGELLAEVHVE